MIKEINTVLEYLNRCINEDVVHRDHYLLFKEKFILLKENIILKNTIKTKELIDWSTNSAPRIIFDGVGDERLLVMIESLNRELQFLRDGKS